MLWRVIYREGVVLDSDTFSTFEEAWAYSRIFPEESRTIPYDSWRYIAKKDAEEAFKKGPRLVIAWVPHSKVEITMYRV